MQTKVQKAKISLKKKTVSVLSQKDQFASDTGVLKTSHYPTCKYGR